MNSIKNIPNATVRATRALAGAVVAAAICALSTAPVIAEEAKAKPRIEVESINPMSGDEEAIQTGLKLYFKWCVACHGPKADGVSRFGEYAGDLTKFWRGYPEFIVIVANGRPKKQMPPWKGVLSDVEISQIAAYLETIAVEGANWGMGR